MFRRRLLPDEGLPQRAPTIPVLGSPVETYFLLKLECNKVTFAKRLKSNLKNIYKLYILLSCVIFFLNGLTTYLQKYHVNIMFRYDVIKHSIMCLMDRE